MSLIDVLIILSCELYDDLGEGIEELLELRCKAGFQMVLFCDMVLFELQLECLLLLDHFVVLADGRSELLERLKEIDDILLVESILLLQHSLRFEGYVLETEDFVRWLVIHDGVHQHAFIRLFKKSL